MFVVRVLVSVLAAAIAVGFLGLSVRKRGVIWAALAAPVSVFLLTVWFRNSWTGVGFLLAAFLIGAALIVSASVFAARIGVLIMGSLAAAMFFGLGLHGPNAHVRKPPTSPTKPTVSSSASPCDTWRMKPADHAGHRWFAQGVQAIQSASTPKQAKKAALVWVRETEKDPQLMSGAVSYLLHKSVGTSILVRRGCASSKAKQLAGQLELAVLTANDTPAQAPANGINSGVNTIGGVYTAAQPGISGNRKAVQIQTQSGSTLWVMARCGNPVTPPPAPTPTTVPPAPRPTPTTVPPAPRPKPKPKPVPRHHRPKPKGKHASTAPPQPPVVTCPEGQIMDRYTQQCVSVSTTTVPPTPTTTVPTVSPPTTEPPGKSDSGPGAVNTTAPPVTSSPAPAPPNTASPTSNPPVP